MELSSRIIEIVVILLLVVFLGGGVVNSFYAQGGLIGTNTCVGSPSSCVSITNSNSTLCVAHKSCSWSGCSGTAEDCTALLNQTFCENQIGCSWDGGCTGESKTCFGNFTYGNCTTQYGCSWSGCIGTPKTCNNYTISNCTTQTGCSFDAGHGNSTTKSVFGLIIIFFFLGVAFVVYKTMMKRQGGE